MNRKDFKPCAVCGKGVVHSGIPLFFRMKIERMGIDVNAVRRQSGLEQMLGNPEIADALSPERSFADPIPGFEDHTVLICEPCSLEPVIIAAIAYKEG